MASIASKFIRVFQKKSSR